MAKPKLALIPAAYGTKFYSILPSDGVGDFDFSRGSVATRINPEGLIETVTSGQSRLDYPLVNGVQKGCPHYLLEPSSTNRQIRSEEFDNSAWGKANVFVTSNLMTSPSGELTADKIIATNTSSVKTIQEVMSGAATTSEATVSIFVKKAEITQIRIVAATNISPFTNWARVSFDLETLQEFGSTLGTFKFEDYGSGWYRLSITGTPLNTSNVYQFSLVKNQNVTFTGNNSDGLFLWGAQVEQKSFSTSYIPTTTTQVTRSAETANGAGDASTFNDSEGVLMAEMSALANDSYRYLSLSDGSNSNNVRFNLTPNANQISFEVTSGGSNQLSYTNNNTNVLLNTKVSIKYKQNDFSVWINGFKLYTNPSGSTPIGLDRINFDRGTGGNVFNGSAKQIQYYNSVLTDSELEQLTSWLSFRDMAEAQSYTIQ